MLVQMWLLKILWLWFEVNVFRKGNGSILKCREMFQRVSSVSWSSHCFYLTFRDSPQCCLICMLLCGRKRTQKLPVPNLNGPHRLYILWVWNHVSVGVHWFLNLLTLPHHPFSLHLKSYASHHPFQISCAFQCPSKMWLLHKNRDPEEEAVPGASEREVSVWREGRESKAQGCSCRQCCRCFPQKSLPLSGVLL